MVTNESSLEHPHKSFKDEVVNMFKQLYHVVSEENQTK